MPAACDTRITPESLQLRACTGECFIRSPKYSCCHSFCFQNRRQCNSTFIGTGLPVYHLRACIKCFVPAKEKAISTFKFPESKLHWTFRKEPMCFPNPSRYHAQKGNTTLKSTDGCIANINWFLTCRYLSTCRTGGLKISQILPFLLQLLSISPSALLHLLPTHQLPWCPISQHLYISSAIYLYFPLQVPPSTPCYSYSQCLFLLTCPNSLTIVAPSLKHRQTNCSSIVLNPDPIHSAQHFNLLLRALPFVLYSVTSILSVRSPHCFLHFPSRSCFINSMWLACASSPRFNTTHIFWARLKPCWIKFPDR